MDDPIRGRPDPVSPSTLCPHCSATLEEGGQACAHCGWTGTVPPAGEPPLASVTSGRHLLEQAALEDLRNETLGQYEILSELGRGGMATVYLAHDIALDRKVAIKLIAPFLLGDENSARFKREARTAAALSHPHIIPIYAVRETDALLYFVMKYVGGRTLESIIKAGESLPIPMIQVILSQAAEALDHAHRRQIVHRDVKPGNIMIDEEGWVIVTDFGIAKATESTGLTTTGTAVGTPTHMSPEQCLAQPVTGASDQYSLGIVGYELLAGQVPFTTNSPMSAMYAHLHEAPSPVVEVRPDCPEHLASAIHRMLEKDPAHRFASMTEVIRAIAAPPLKHEDPIRLAMSTLAQADAQERTASFPSTPRSPIPATRSRSPTPAESSAPTRTVKPRWTAHRGLRWGIPGVVATLLLVWLAVARPFQPSVDRQNPPSTPPAAIPVEAATPPAEDITSEPPATAEVPAPPVRAPAQAAPPQITAVSLRPDRLTLAPGEVSQLALDARDASGGGATAHTIRWASSNQSVATVSPRGMVTGVEAGIATISADVDGLTAGVEVTVTPPPPAGPAAVVVAPTTLELEVGQTGQLRGVVQDSAGKTLGNGPLRWTSSAPPIADVSANGVVVAVAAGTAMVSASFEDWSGSATVTVTEPPGMAAPAPDPTTGIPSLLEAYAAAIQSRQVDRVTALYPTISQSSRQAWADLFRSYDDITATILDPSVEIAAGGDAVSFEVALVLRNSREEQRINLTSHATVAPGQDGWHFVDVTQGFVQR